MTADRKSMPPVLSLDLNCPKCAYNLRGLPGEIVTCPECGSQWSRSDLQWAAWRKTRHSLPIVNDLDMLGAMGTFGPLGLATLAGLYAFFGSVVLTKEPWGIVFLGGICCVLIAMFMAGTRTLCRRYFGWRLGLRLVFASIAEISMLFWGGLAALMAALLVIGLIGIRSSAMMLIWFFAFAGLVGFAFFARWCRRRICELKFRWLLKWLESVANSVRVEP